MQVNKYSVNVELLGSLIFEIAASTSEEALSLVRGHMAKIAERQWEAPHAAPGVKSISEDLSPFIHEPSLIASENP